MGLPFELVVAERGTERRYLARAVIDASGTWTMPNPLGAGGVPAVGGRAHADRIAYGIPDVLGGGHGGARFQLLVARPVGVPVARQVDRDHFAPLLELARKVGSPIWVRWAQDGLEQCR